MGIRIALAGNPNCGKTTLFNALTGSNQYVGNWPGVTVEKKEGKLKKHSDVIITDLPGIYSLSPYTEEEVVARNYLVDEKPDAILNIVDGTNLERNLYLTTQLLELGIPMIVALNMMDVVKKSGNKINTEELSRQLACPVVEMSALRSDGITEAAEAAIKIAGGEAPVPKHKFSGVVEHALAHIEEAALHDLPAEQQRWYAVKIFENDEKVLEKLNINKDILDHIKTDIDACEKELDDDAESIITNERYICIGEIIKSCYHKKSNEKLSKSDKIDKIITNRFLALPIFAAIMIGIYYIAVSTIGDIVTNWTNDVLFGTWIQGGMETLLTNAHASDWVISLVCDGIIGGIAAPVGFAPQMAIVFLFLSILEDCGYMSRVAFIMDRIFRKFGVSGKSFIPFLISSGCGVPGIMATRTIENEKDRRMTMMTTTAIPCGAKMPVLALLGGYIMGDKNGLLTAGFYFLGMAVVICSCIILKKTKLFSGEPAPFVMELPQYHIPSIKNVLLHVWERVWAFLKKAGTILFLCCAVMWFLGDFGIIDGKLTLIDTESQEEIEHCFLAVIGSVIAPIFKPLGFGTWRAVAASLSGFVAKEGITSTMGVIAGFDGGAESFSESMRAAFDSFVTSTGSETTALRHLSAFAFLVFNLFDSPCLAAISTMAKEIGSKKYFWFAIAFQNVFAYCLTLMIYQIAGIAMGVLSFSFATVVAIALALVVLYLLVRPDPYKRKLKRQ